MTRREFIALSAARRRWPLAARAQQAERVRRIGVLVPAAADDPECQARAGAFLQALANWAGPSAATCGSTPAGPTANADEIRRHAAELAALAPDVILAHGTSTVAPLLQATRTVPIVFPVVADPVGAGFVESLARPGGNATGFMTYEYSMSGKWLELLKQIAPGVTRAAVLRDPDHGSGIGQFAAIQAVAPSLGWRSTRSTCATPARSSAPSRPSRARQWRSDRDVGRWRHVHRELIVTLAARHKLPAVYSDRISSPPAA